jgi:hypothetical protein
MKNEEEIANIIVFWLSILGVLFGACIIGLTFSIIKAIANSFGVGLNFL